RNSIPASSDGDNVDDEVNYTTDGGNPADEVNPAEEAADEEQSAEGAADEASAEASAEEGEIEDVTDEELQAVESPRADIPLANHAGSFQRVIPIRWALTDNSLRTSS